MRSALVFLAFTLAACDSSPQQGEQGPVGEPGPTGEQGPAGEDGAQGPAGEDGADGLACWDLDASGTCDVGTEDIDSDGDCDTLDCRGPAGPQGPQGAQGATGPQGTTGPQGATGPQGDAGPPGADGLDGDSCWDTDGDANCDLPSEDIDGDGDCDPLDCQVAAEARPIRARNWLFGHPQGGGAGNVGLELPLPTASSTSGPSWVRLTKFAVDPGETVNAVDVVLYPNNDGALTLLVEESTFDPDNLFAAPIASHTADTAQPLVAQGANALTATPQRVRFTFDPPIVVTGEIMSLYLGLENTVGGAVSMGVWQLVVE